MEHLQPQVTELKGYEDRIKKVQDEIKAQQEQAVPLTESIRERDYWAQIINDVNSRIPPEFIWIVSFEPQVIAAAPAAKGNGPGPKPAPGPKRCDG